MVNRDFRDLFAALNEARANYLLVGAHAVGFYAEPRFTKDLDIWIEATAQNAPRVMSALRTFGAPSGCELFGARNGARPRSTMPSIGTT